MDWLTSLMPQALPSPRTALAYMVWAARVVRVCCAAIESGGLEALKELAKGPAAVAREVEPPPETPAA